MAERNTELAKDIIDATQGAEFNLGIDASHQFIIRAVTDGVAAAFVNSGVKTYAGAADATAEYAEVHLPHLPVYADAATAQAVADTELAPGQLFIVETTGTIGVKLA